MAPTFAMRDFPISSFRNCPRAVAIPSIVLIATFPTKPSQTKTSAFPAKKSLPSTFPTKFSPVRRNSSHVSRVRSVPFESSSPMLTTPTRGRGIPRIVREYASPMYPNCRRWAALQSTFAPASTRTTGPCGVGMVAAIAGRSTPWIFLRIRNPPAMTAPEFPALTKEDAFPSATSRSPTRIDESRFFRRAMAGMSHISTTSEACSTSMSAPETSIPRNSARIRSSWPTRIRERPFVRADSTAPRTISRGAWSPPIASTAIFIGWKRVSVFGFCDDFPTLVGPARRADGMGALGRLALRADAHRRLGQLLVRAPLVPAALRSASFRIRHGLLPFPFQVLENFERALCLSRDAGALLQIPVLPAHGADPAAPLGTNVLQRELKGHLLPQDVVRLDPRAVIIPDIEVFLMKFDLCCGDPIPALRGQDRLERLPEPERHRVGTTIANAFPLRVERPLDPDIAALYRQEQIRVDQPQLPPR